MGIVGLAVAFIVWVLGCFCGYFLIFGINQIIKAPRISSVIVFLLCIFVMYHTVGLGYIPADLLKRLGGSFILGISVPCGIVFWTEDDVFPL